MNYSIYNRLRFLYQTLPVPINFPFIHWGQNLIFHQNWMGAEQVQFWSKQQCGIRGISQWKYPVWCLALERKDAGRGIPSSIKLVWYFADLLVPPFPILSTLLRKQHFLTILNQGPYSLLVRVTPFCCVSPAGAVDSVHSESMYTNPKCYLNYFKLLFVLQNVRKIIM